MAERTLTHKGHSIVIREDSAGPEAVLIDGRPLTITVSSAGYWTPSQAYRRFASLEDLARAVAEITAKPE